MDLFTCGVCGFDGDVQYEEGDDGIIRCLACQNEYLRQAIKRVHELFMQKLAAEYPDHPWLKRKHDEAH